MSIYTGEHKYRRWGLPGSRIEGSRYYRGYCILCGEPVRTVAVQPLHPKCRGCTVPAPAPGTGLTRRQARKLGELLAEDGWGLL